MDNSILSTLSQNEIQFYGGLWRSVLSPDEEYMSADNARNLFYYSGLSRETLSTIWEMIDTMDTGYLTWEQFCSAMRIIAAVQLGVAPQIEHIYSAPLTIANMDYFPQGAEQATTVAMPPADHNVWVISDEDRREYIKVFTKYDTNNDGLVDAKDAKEIFATSGLPRETLFHIWDLADRSRRGQLDLGEFIVASHLVVSARLSQNVPSSLPPSLLCEFDPPEISRDEDEDILLKPSLLNRKKSTHITTESNDKPLSSVIVDDVFKSKPKLNVNATINPADLISAVIEGDRSLTDFMQSRTSEVADDLLKIRSLNEEFVMELKEKREQLSLSISQQQTVQEEVNELRTEYTHLYALRKEVLLQANSISGQTKILEAEKEFLQRSINEIRSDIEVAIGIAGDLENSANLASSSINTLSIGRQEANEALNNFREKYHVEQAEVDDLGVALQRLNQEKSRLTDSNVRQMERINQNLQDHAALSIAANQATRTVVQKARSMTTTNDKFVNSVGGGDQGIHNSVTMLNSPLRPQPPGPRDMKGLLHNTVQRSTADRSWASFAKKTDDQWQDNNSVSRRI
eukprot:GHVH01004291.1.p1 GENE.GHVH01004291.1~~GHVH01004291.1.p1  ORF type:complete len:573 (+),score=90.71 GHVH01004291.1:116-1834(+)